MPSPCPTESMIDTTNLLTTAENYAIEAHGDQKYGTLPYRYHLQMVVDTLRAASVTDPEILAAGWLHDVAEDTERTVEDIRDVFGDRVARLVDCCTGVGSDRAARNASIAEKCGRTGNMDAVLVKFADRVANLQALGDAERVDAERLSKKYNNEMEAFLAIADPHLGGAPLPAEVMQPYLLLRASLEKHWSVP